jgi:hypothetical protein
MLCGTTNVPSLEQIKQKGGVGLGALYLVSLLIAGYYLDASTFDRSVSAGIIAVIPPFMVWGAAKQFYKKWPKIFATEKVAEAFVRIKFHQGSKRFYNKYSDEVQEELDDLDEKFFNQIVNILSGIVITAAIPVFAVLKFGEFGYTGIVAGFGLAAVFGYGLSIASYRKMNEVLEYSTQVAKVTDEA